MPQRSAHKHSSRNTKHRDIRVLVRLENTRRHAEAEQCSRTKRSQQATPEVMTLSRRTARVPTRSTTTTIAKTKQMQCCSGDARVLGGTGGQARPAGAVQAVVEEERRQMLQHCKCQCKHHDPKPLTQNPIRRRYCCLALQTKLPLKRPQRNVLEQSSPLRHGQRGRR